jgi:putative ABC transport system permease protein
LKRAARDWRLREIRLLLMALTISVLAITSIGFFTDRVDRGMRLQGAALLGADLLVQSSRPLSDSVRQLTRAFNATDVVEFRSVILSGERSLLTEVKAVGETYPLRGELQTSTALDQPGSTITGTPKPGEAWAAADVFYQLGLMPGSSIQLGNSSFILTRIIKFEPDAGGSVFRFAPRLMINLTSLAETGLITPASRATYKLLISGDEQAMLGLRHPLQQALSSAETLLTVEQGRPEVNAALNRAVRFMKLATVLTIIIAGAAVALTTMSYARRERHTIAILKTLGATHSRLWKDYALRFVMLVLIACVIGSLLGLVFQYVLAQLLSSLLNISLPAVSYKPLAAGLATAVLSLSGFALPSILRVIQTPPMRVMRAETTRPQRQVLLSIICISMAMAVFLFWQAGEFELAAIVFGGLVGGLGLMLFVSWLVTRLFRRYHVHRGGGWQLGLANIGRYGRRAALLITTIGIGIFALSLLSSVREDLLIAWQNRIPEQAPNHFMVNIQAADLGALDIFLKQRKLEDTQIYPMIRGRLRAINGMPARAENFENRQAKNTLRREINLTTSLVLPAENKILAGHWFKSQPGQGINQPPPGISVESELAKGLGVTAFVQRPCHQPAPGSMGYHAAQFLRYRSSRRAR